MEVDEVKKYYALGQEGNTASVTIYGDITSWPWLESDVRPICYPNRLKALKRT